MSSLSLCHSVRSEADLPSFPETVLVSKGLLPWVKSANICPEIKGSDHCPVFIEFHDEIVLPGASAPTRISDLLNATSTPHAKTAGPPSADGERTASAPPRAAAMYYAEFNLRKITSFFTKRADPSTTGPGPASDAPPDPSPTSSTITIAPPPIPPSPAGTIVAGPSSLPARPVSIDLTLSPPPSPSSTMPPLPVAKTVSKGKSRATLDEDESPKKATKKKKKGQLKLSSFFAPTQSKSPLPPASPPADETHKKKRSVSADEQSPVKRARVSTAADDEEADHLFAMALADQAADDDGPAGASGGAGAGTAKSEVAVKAWGEIMKPIPKPRCTVHGVDCMEKTVRRAPRIPLHQLALTSFLSCSPQTTKPGPKYVTYPNRRAQTTADCSSLSFSTFQQRKEILDVFLVRLI